MASRSRIAGITIEIGGNTTKLQKALQGVNKTINKTQSELRDINRLLKFDPGNTELLKQKQDALKREIDATTDKLKQEKEALKLAAQQNLPDEEQARLKREVIATEQELKKLNKEYKKFGSVAGQKLKAVGSKLEEVGGKISAAGQKLMPLTVGIAALGAGSIAAFNDVDKGLDTITVKTGASGEALDEMGQIMENIATTIPTDFETAGNAIGEVNTRFGATGDELETLSSQFIKFAQLNNTDVTSSVDGVQKALAAFGLGAESAGSLMDALTATAQKTGVSVDDLQNNLVTNAATFQELGLNIEQATVFMGQAETSGANYTAVVSGMRKALKNATEQGIPLNEALQDLQKSIVDGTGDVDGLTYAYDLFGKSGDQVYQAVKNGTLSFNDLASAVEDMGGTVSDTFDATLDPMDSFTTTLNDLKLVGAEVGGTLLQMLIPVMQKVGEVVKALKGWWDGLDESHQKTIITIAGIVAAIAPALMAIGGVISMVGKAMGTISSLMSLMNPTTLIIAGIIAAIVAVILVIKNWGKITAWLKKVWKKVSGFLTDTWENIKKTAKTVFTAIKLAITLPIQTAKRVIIAVWNKVTGFLSEAWETIKSTASTVWDAIKTVITTPIQAAKRIVKKAIDKISSVFDIFNTVKDTVTSVFETIGDAISNPIETARDLVSGAIDTIKGLFPLSIGKIFSNLKLPHFSITGGEAPYGLFGKGKRPSINVEWYAKAMDGGMILDSPTIFGAMNGSLLGAGEAGSEAIIGTRSLSSIIQNSVTAAMTSMSSTIAAATYKAVTAAMAGGGRPIEANLYMFKNSPQMGKWIVETYDTYKARLG